MFTIEVLTTIILFVLGISGIAIYFILNKYIEKEYIIYTAIVFVIMALTGFSSFGLSIYPNPYFWHILLFCIWFALGTVHNYFYNKYRDTGIWFKILNCTSTFMLGVSAFLLLSCLFNPIWTFSFLIICSSFLIYPLVIESKFYALEVTNSDFEVKWDFPPSFYDASGIPEGGVEITFHVSKRLADQKRVLIKKAHPWVKIPDRVDIGSAFRIAINEYEQDIEKEQNKDSLLIKDFGYEKGNENIWWLFSVKWLLFKPDTWFRRNRFLNPDSSLYENNIKDCDVIIAKRMTI